MSLYKEFIITSSLPMQQLAKFLTFNAKAMNETGTPIRVIVTTGGEKRNTEQNKRLWKLYEKVSEQAWVNGQQYSKDIWHEYSANLYMPKVEFILPSGEIVSRRKSTSELTVKEFSEYMNKVEVYAVTELGVQFDS